jgi:hypothetical protein
MVEVDERVSRPDLRLKFFASHDIAGAFQQYREYLQWLASEAQLYTAFTQLTRPDIQFKNVEPKRVGDWGRLVGGGLTLAVAMLALAQSQFPVPGAPSPWAENAFSLQQLGSGENFGD